MRAQGAAPRSLPLPQLVMSAGLLPGMERAAVAGTLRLLGFPRADSWLDLVAVSFGVTLELWVLNLRKRGLRESAVGAAWWWRGWVGGGWEGAMHVLADSSSSGAIMRGGNCSR